MAKAACLWLCGLIQQWSVTALTWRGINGDLPWTEFHPQSLVKVWPGQRIVPTEMQSLKKDHREHLAELIVSAEFNTDTLTHRECQTLRSSHLHMLYSVFFPLPVITQRCECCTSQWKHWWNEGLNLGLRSCHILFTIWSGAVYDLHLTKQTKFCRPRSVLHQMYAEEIRVNQMAKAQWTPFSSPISSIWWTKWAKSEIVYKRMGKWHHLPFIFTIFSLPLPWDIFSVCYRSCNS